MIEKIVAVWEDLIDFIVGLFPDVTSLFVTTSSSGSELTFVGVLAVIMAGVSLILLVFNLIRSFLSMRG